METWKPIPSADGYYEASNLGRIRRAKAGHGATVGRVLKQHIDKKGYHRVLLVLSTGYSHRLVHRLVAETFLAPIPTGKQVNHWDLNKSNNRPRNLKYTTARGNVRHAMRNGVRWWLRLYKLTEKQVVEIRKLYRRRGKWNTYTLGRRFGVGRHIVSKVVNGAYFK